MKRRQIRQFEMLVRVRDFGTAHTALFPQSTLADEAFATIGAAVSELSTFTGAKAVATRGSATTKAAARAALQQAIFAVSRTARAIAAQQPGFRNTFQVPQRRPDSTLAPLARSLAQQAEPLQGQFVERGMPATFVADLAARADAFETAIRVHDEGRQARSEANARIEAALAAGLHAVQQLDVMVVNHVRDPGTIARWRQARRVWYPNYASEPVAPEQPSAAAVSDGEVA